MALRENAVVKLAAVAPLALPTLHPFSTWLGSEINGDLYLFIHLYDESILTLFVTVYMCRSLSGIGLGDLSKLRYPLLHVHGL